MMPTQATIHVDGDPVAQPRSRHVTKGGKTHTVSTASAKAKLYQEKVRQACAVARTALGDDWDAQAVEIDWFFYFGTKAGVRFGQRHTIKPDSDNIMKLFMDQAKKAGLIPGDDCRVSDGSFKKRWARDGGAVMVIRKLDPIDLADDLDDDIGAFAV